MNSHRHIVTRTLFDDFVMRNGATCNRRGESLVGQPFFAVNIPWNEVSTAHFHMRFISEWLDKTGSDPFNPEIERHSFDNYLANSKKWTPIDGPTSFTRLPRAYGSWRTPLFELNLGVAILVPTLTAAAMWGFLFQQSDIYDLAQKKCLSLARLMENQ